MLSLTPNPSERLTPKNLVLTEHLPPVPREPAAAAKSHQSCPTLCDPIDGSPPGSAVPGILQARALEWVAISFSSAWKSEVKVKLLSCVRLFTTPWTVAYQAPLSMGVPRQEFWSGVPLPSPKRTRPFVKWIPGDHLENEILEAMFYDDVGWYCLIILLVILMVFAPGKTFWWSTLAWEGILEAVPTSERHVGMASFQDMGRVSWEESHFCLCWVILGFLSRKTQSIG